MASEHRIRRPGSRRLGRAVALCILAAVVLPAAAAAEDPLVTSQARLANARFLAFAPPPDGGGGAVCLVDTGLDLNPDTESNVIERHAVDGGGPGDGGRGQHGTSMAMTMGSPINQWGSVGAWPAVRIVSVRALQPGEEYFRPTSYTQSIDRCRDAATRLGNVKAINLSLGGPDPSEQDIERLRDYFVGARTRAGLNVVVAAGNGGGAVEFPGAVPEAFTVAAADTTGAYCSFSSRGEGQDLAAPGCELDVALPDGTSARASGTSDAAAFTSAIITALRSYRPDLGVDAAEQLLLSTARPTPAGALLDVEAAFRAAGLGHIVDAGNAAIPPSSSPPSGGGQPPVSERPERGPLAEQLPRPRLAAASYRRGRLAIRLANRPPGALVTAKLVYSAGRGEFRRRERTIERVSSAIRIAAPRSWSRIELEYRYFELQPSEALVVGRRSVIRRGGSNKRRDRRH